MSEPLYRARQSLVGSLCCAKHLDQSELVWPFVLLAHTCLSLCFGPVRAAGEGDVSFAEFYSWWQDSKNKEGALNIDTSAGGEPFTITIVRI